MLKKYTVRSNPDGGLVKAWVDGVPVEDKAWDQAAYKALMQVRGMTDSAIQQSIYFKQMANTKRKLRQGLGRAIRSASDSAHILILDPRFPLPTTITTDRHARAYNNPRYLSLADCLPDRFRSGKSAVYPSAKVFVVVEPIDAKIAA